LPNTKKITSIILAVIICNVVIAQVGFSVNSDVGVARSFKQGQRYFSFGQTVNVGIHITEKNGAYFGFSYYSNGRFTNKLVADAKQPGTIPQTISYDNNAKLGVRNFSIGYQHYFKGNALAEEKWNLYGKAGFGLLSGTVSNAHNVIIDTAAYNLPVLQGEAKFKRINVDLAIGFEKYLSGDLYFYSEARMFIPTTDYPSKYLFVNDDSPLTGSIAAGIRILF
jgi:hypothetical protein